jgi:hypothetical protein
MMTYRLLTCWLILAAPLVAEEITYTKDVAPILWKNCAQCHRPGEVGPFSLLDYEDAAKRADFIAEITASRRMPPWKPEPGYGDFLDARRLSDRELSVLARWAENGAPRGDLKDLPPPPEFPEGWRLGEPDMVVKMPEPFEVAASGRDVFRCFVIPLDIAADRTVAGVEFHPGNRLVVHHALFYLDNTGKARKLDEADAGLGYRSFGGIGFAPTGGLGGWAPGATPRRLPEGMGHMLKKGSDLVFQVHYHPNGKPEADQSELGIFFTRGPVRKIAVSFALGSRDIEIPAGESRHRVAVSMTLPADIQAVGVSPHMHWLGKEMKLEATLPDGQVVPMVWIRDWDFNWQGNYQYQKLISLPKGTRLDLEAFYDNSAENPNNPNDPPKTAHFGEQTEDEMCFCFVQFVANTRPEYVDVLRASWTTLSATSPWKKWLSGEKTSQGKTN